MIAPIEHLSKQAMADQLAALIADLLSATISERGRASLAVSGGTTPILLFESLSKTPLDWTKVTVTLTDERCVPADSERSNEGFVRRSLLTDDAEAAAFLPLYGESSLSETAAELSLPLDVAIFGLGEDFHTASLFPDAKETAAALDPACALPLALIRPSSQPEERITLTAPPILNCRHKFLILHGEAKKAALQKAQSIGDPQQAPVNILFVGGDPAEVHLAP
jgi:6-phosphogluconolactonase